MKNQIQLQANDVISNQWKIVFDRSTERWGHRVLVAGENQDQLLLTSLEGNAEQAWPCSPPLQDVSLHQPSPQAVLGVGMSGKSHWSASFSVEEKALFADLACLYRGPETNSMAWLGSSYQLGEQVEVEQQNESLAVLSFGKSRLFIQPVSNDGCQSKLVFRNREIQIVPDEMSFSLGKPVRWGYRFYSG